jgi:membrane-associated protease RseP (regulator of RpoE activity)
MNAEGRIYGRYGGRDASGAEGRMSHAGLRYAMEAALAEHRKNPTAKPAAAPKAPLLPEHIPAAKRRRGGECIHCHNVKEFLREDAKRAGTWKKDELWVFPMPENIGLTLEIDRGNRVKSVTADSPAAKAGLRPGDMVRSVNGVSAASFGDVQFGLHKAPAAGKVALAFSRDGGAEASVELELADGWRKTNITWRPSLLDILPSLPVYGEELTAADKQALGLSPTALAFKQRAPVPTECKPVGLEAGDVITGIDGLKLEMKRDEFLAYVRRNYVVGEAIRFNVIRAGKALTLTPYKLR